MQFLHTSSEGEPGIASTVACRLAFGLRCFKRRLELKNYKACGELLAAFPGSKSCAVYRSVFGVLLRMRIHCVSLSSLAPASMHAGGRQHGLLVEMVSG